MKPEPPVSIYVVLDTQGYDYRIYEDLEWMGESGDVSDGMEVLVYQHVDTKTLRIRKTVLEDASEAPAKSLAIKTPKGRRIKTNGR